MKRKGVTLVLLWQEYREAHPEGYGYTWFCEQFRAFENRTSPSFSNRHEAGAVMQSDYAGPTIPITDPATGVVRQAQIFVAVLGASSYAFAWASLSLALPDWIEAQVRALGFLGGVTKAIVCDNLEASVVKPLWFEPSITKTFADMAAHYDTTILPTRPRKPRDKGKVEGAVLIVERWILARLRNMQFFSVEALNATIAELLTDLKARPMRRIGRSRRDLFEEIECPALRTLPSEPSEYAEWKQAKVHPDFHIDVLHSFYSVPTPPAVLLSRAPAPIRPGCMRCFGIPVASCAAPLARHPLPFDFGIASVTMALAVTRVDTTTEAPAQRGCR